ncbi:hypothetical protein L6452_14585 [Arctium lappa]|uniref:Uncharacterized protein n=1 Tax=Arctium lappa TaxID=4217 RepID=A0ACB9CLD1_ARCLA|nr:hypothetical protein L6452_14585 [Arctium lappa]
MKKISESIKRSLDDADDCELEEIIKPRNVVSKYPPPKFRKGVQVVRDFPPGCGIIDNSIGHKAERIPLINLDNDDSKIGNMTSNHKDKLAESRCFENDKFKPSKPKDFGGNTHLGSRPTGKVQIWDPRLEEGDVQKPEETVTVGSRKEQFRREISRRSSGKVKFWDPRLEEAYVQKPEDTTTVVSQKEQVRREKIKEAMTMFDDVYKQLYQENRSKPKGEKTAHWRVTIEAAKIVKQRKKLMDADKDLGRICGIQVGDKFKFRAQLEMVGLHCQLQSGIDYANIRGKNLAISIVDSQRYSNERESCDVLLYSGHGGITFLGGKREDQKLERGNLALKNSMNEKNPVRVIRKLHSRGGRKNNDVFVYDGLYIVVDYKHKKGAEGKMVFMFQLKRIPGQPQLHKMLNASR